MILLNVDEVATLVSLPLKGLCKICATLELPLCDERVTTVRIEFHVNGEMIKDNIKGQDAECVLDHLKNLYHDGRHASIQERGGMRKAPPDYVDLTKYGITDVRYENPNGDWVDIPEINIKHA